MARKEERESVWYECEVFFKKGKPKKYVLSTYEALSDLEDKCIANNAVGTVVSSRIEKRLYVKKY